MNPLVAYSWLCADAVYVRQECPASYPQSRFHRRGDGRTATQIQWPGGTLVVNDQELGGSRTYESGLRVAVLNERGETMSDFADTNCVPLAGDYVEGKPIWMGNLKDWILLLARRYACDFF